jgi:hypothetical protein
LPAATTPSTPLDVVLHIGSGKTGTSSLQKLLQQNRKALREHGTLYPRSPGRTRHLQLGHYAKAGGELDRQVSWHRKDSRRRTESLTDLPSRLLAEIDRVGPSRLLLSDEGLYGSSVDALSRLRGLTDQLARTLRIVVYLRRQDDHLCSRYQQVVKSGEIRRLSERAEQPDLARTYDYLARLRVWQQRLEPTWLVVRSFERDRFVGGSLVEDFLTAADLGVRSDDLDQVETRNISLDAESVEFLRIHNLYLVEHEGAKAGLIDNRPIVARLATVSTGPTLSLPASFLDAFMAQWSDSNRAVAREFLGEHELFLAPRKSSNTTTSQHLDPDRVDDLVSLLELPEHRRGPLRRIAEREARTG